MCHDLIDRRFHADGKPRADAPKPRQKLKKPRAKYEAGTTGSKLYRADAVRLRAMQAAGGTTASEFIRQAVRERLERMARAELAS